MKLSEVPPDKEIRLKVKSIVNSAIPYGIVREGDHIFMYQDGSLNNITKKFILHKNHVPISPELYQYIEVELDEEYYLRGISFHEQQINLLTADLNIAKNVFDIS